MTDRPPHGTCQRCGARLQRREQPEGFCDRCLRTYMAPALTQLQPPKRGRKEERW